jgi:hypothetical protein
MATFLDMITRIQDDLVNESVTVAQIKAAIITAISNYENNQFYFNQKVGTFPTVISQEYYGAAALADIPNILRIRASNITIPGLKVQLNPVDFAEIDMQQTGAYLGRPVAYASFQQQLRLYPIPDAVYVVQLAYVYKFATLSADADTNAWTNDGEELIRQAAKRRLAQDTFYSDKIAARAEKLENEAFEGLRAETRQRLPNSMLYVPAMPLSHRSFDITRGW